MKRREERGKERKGGDGSCVPTTVFKSRLQLQRFVIDEMTIKVTEGH